MFSTFHFFAALLGLALMSVLLNGRFHRAACVVLLTFILPCFSAPAADTNVPGDAERSYLQLQGLIEENQRAVETAGSNAIILEARLRSMESALADARAEQQRTIEHSNRIMLLCAGGIAGFGIVALVLGAFGQWTAINRLAAEIRLSAERPPAHFGGLNEANARFLGMFEQLERRLHDLEGSAKARASLPEAATIVPGNGMVAAENGGQIDVLLNKAQTLLKLDKTDAALQCLDDVLVLDPDNAQAMVKRGAVLERLQRFDEAIGCYDRALAQDKTMTMAYLGKGAILNRLERYSEALACYEQALQKSGKPPSQAGN